MKPEEEVRAKLVEHLVKSLGYPRALIAIEKELLSLPHIHEGPKRRLDLLVYAKNGTPLLLVECKAEKIDEKTLEQALGYNYLVKAPFVAIVGKDKALTVKADGEIIGGLISYDTLSRQAL